jgi:transposase
MEGDIGLTDWGHRGSEKQVRRPVHGLMASICTWNGLRLLPERQQEESYPSGWGVSALQASLRGRGHRKTARRLVSCRVG